MTGKEGLESLQMRMNYLDAVKFKDELTAIRNDLNHLEYCKERAKKVFDKKQEMKKNTNWTRVDWMLDALNDSNDPDSEYSGAACENYYKRKDKIERDLEVLDILKEYFKTNETGDIQFENMEFAIFGTDEEAIMIKEWLEDGRKKI